MNPWDELIVACGNQTKAAAAIGLEEDQFCRYRKRERTPRPNRAKDLARRATLLLGRTVSPSQFVFPEAPIEEAADLADAG